MSSSKVTSFFPVVSASHRILFRLETVLLILIAINLILTSSIYPAPEFSIFAILITVLFGIVGAKIPTQNNFNKAIYTAVEFGIILTPNLIDPRIPVVPLLGLIAVIRSFQMFRITGQLIVAGLAISTFIYSVFLRSQFVILNCRFTGTVDPAFEQILTNPLNFQLSSALSFGLTLIFAFPLILALLLEQRSQAKLATAHAQLRQYALQVEAQSTLQERTRIAREIHDSLGQVLAAQSIQLENAALFLEMDLAKSRTSLVTARQLGRTALKEVRQSVATLRVEPFQGKSLEEAINQILENFSQATGMLPAIVLNVRQTLPLEMRTVLYRILQEALTNIGRHSYATQVTIQVQEKPHKGKNAINLTVIDNGQGFDPEQDAVGFGLQCMRERAIALDGEFWLRSQPGYGCEIRVSLPLSSERI